MDMLGVVQKIEDVEVSTSKGKQQYKKVTIRGDKPAKFSLAVRVDTDNSDFAIGDEITVILH